MPGVAAAREHHKCGMPAGIARSKVHGMNCIAAEGAPPGMLCSMQCCIITKRVANTGELHRKPGHAAHARRTTRSRLLARPSRTSRRAARRRSTPASSSTPPVPSPTRCVSHGLKRDSDRGTIALPAQRMHVTYLCPGPEGGFDTHLTGTLILTPDPASTPTWLLSMFSTTFAPNPDLGCK